MERRIHGQYTFKICILGLYSTGKSSLLHVFKTGNKISFQMAPTVGQDIQFKTIEVAGNVVRLSLWDTGGQEKFNGVTQNLVRNAHGILLVYSYDKTENEIRKSINTWMEFVNQSGLPGAPVVLLGNKVDLPQDQRSGFTTSVAESIARSLGLTFFETSAKDLYNVDAAFNTLVAEIIQRVKGNQLKYTAPKKLKQVKQKSSGSCC